MKKLIGVFLFALLSLGVWVSDAQAGCCGWCIDCDVTPDGTVCSYYCCASGDCMEATVPLDPAQLNLTDPVDPEVATTYPGPVGAFTFDPKDFRVRRGPGGEILILNRSLPGSNGGLRR